MRTRKVMSTGCIATLLLIAAGISYGSPGRFVNADISDSWTTRLSMPTARFNFGLAEVNGKIYAIGGQRGWYGYPYPPYTYCNVTEEYNPLTNTWITRAPMPSKRGGFAVAVAYNKIYVIGGVEAEGGSTLADRNYEYDPITDTWTERAPMPTRRSLFPAATVNNKIYAIGGVPEGTVEEYDPLTDTWTKKGSPLPNYVGYVSATALNNKIYVMGGYPSGGGKLNQVYDPLTDTWELKADLPTGRQWAGVAAASGKIFVIGGSSDPYVFTAVNEIYDPEADRWSTGTPMPTAREGFGMVSVGNKIFAIGGYYAPASQSWVYLTTNEEYTIPGDYAPPTISILSPENKTYHEKNVPLTFTITETASWIGYSLDEQLNLSISGNTVLSELSQGSHSVTVYARDTAGNTGTSGTTYFNIEVPTPSFPYEWSIIVIVVVIGASGIIGFFVYRKRKAPAKSESIPLKAI